MHFHNARTRQRKIILDLFFDKLFFIPWSSFATIFLLSTELSFVCNHPHKVHYLFYSVCTLNLAIFQTTIFLAREKRARQTKIYSVHFHGVRPFSCCTPTANRTLLGQNSTCLVSTSVLIHLNISILT